MIQNLIFGESLKAKRNQQKESFVLKHSFAQLYLTSLNIVKNIMPQQRQNLTQFTNFPANMFLFGYRENIGTAPFSNTQDLCS